MTGSIKKRGKSWACVFDAPRDERTGKRRQVWLSGFRSERDAQRALRKALAAVDAGTFIEPNRQTVAEFLQDWLAKSAAKRVGAVSLAHYTLVVEKYLIPGLGHHRLTALRPLHIEDWEQGLLARGLSGTTVNHLHVILAMALKQAVRWQLLARNPCEGVDPPRSDTAERQPPEGADLARLLIGLQDSWLYLPALLAVGTTLRREDVLGLAWRSLSLPEPVQGIQGSGVLTVERALVEPKRGGELVFKEPKTAAGRRRVSLLPLQVLALRTHRAAQAAARLQYGPEYQASLDLVIARPDGSPYRPDTLTRQWRAAADRLGFAGVRFHDLRHTSISLSLQSGIPLRVVSSRAGHRDPGFTLSRYAHVLQGQDEAAALTMEQVLTDLLTQDGRSG